MGRGCIFHSVHGVLSTGRGSGRDGGEGGMGPAGKAREGQKGWLGGSLLRMLI